MILDPSTPKVLKLGFATLGFRSPLVSKPQGLRRDLGTNKLSMKKAQRSKGKRNS